MTSISQDATDAELMACWQSDPEAAEECFRLLYERHRRRTLNFYRRMTQNETLAEDLNQTLYTELLTAAKSYHEQGRFVSWLFRIARNVFYDTVIRPHERQMVKVDPDAYAQPLEQKDDSARRPDRIMDNVDRVDCFLKCFEELPSMEKAVLVDHYFHGDPVDKLTQRMGLDNPSGARKYKVSALRKLKSAMEERLLLSDDEEEAK